MGTLYAYGPPLLSGVTHTVSLTLSSTRTLSLSSASC